MIRMFRNLSDEQKVEFMSILLGASVAGMLNAKTAPSSESEEETNTSEAPDDDQE